MFPGPRASLAFPAALALGVTFGLVSSPAHAQTKDLAQLRQIFQDGRQFEDSDKWSEALAKFKEVAAEKMTPQVRFHIALCEENLGKLVSAKHGFELAASEAAAAGSAAVEVPAAAKQHVDALTARVAKLTFEVKGKITTSKVLLDDAPLAPKDLSSEVEVDPGAHVVEARNADGKQLFKKELTLPEKGSEKVELAIDDSDAATPPPPPPTPPSSRKMAYIVGGAGLGALAFSGLFFGLRAANVATIKATCTNQVQLTGCSLADEGLTAQGKAFTGVADALGVVGLAGVGTGVALFILLSPKSDEPASSSRAKSPITGIWVTPTGPGLAAGGSF